MSECEFYECGFLEKHRTIDKILCAGIETIYCKGKELEDCERKKYVNKYDQQPPDTMRPDGKTFFFY